MTAPCCINGYRKPRWVLDKTTDLMKQATARCVCENGKNATTRVFARLGIEAGDFKAMAAKCDADVDAVHAADHAEDDQALAAWASYEDGIAKHAAAERQAAHDKVWLPRYAAGYTECTRCGGTGYVAPYGTCFRCEGRQVDPIKQLKEAAK
jgi:hypothetical protein